MKKTETLRQLAARENETQLTKLSNQIDTLRQARLESVGALAAALEPLARAMAALTDETRLTLDEIDIKAREHSESIKQQIEAAAAICQRAAASAQKSAEHLERSMRHEELSHYLLTLATGIISALLVSVLWLWLGR